MNLKETKFDAQSIKQMITSMWELPEREYQYVAVDYLVKHKKKLTEEHVDLIEYLITTKSWLDTVDALASHVVGELFSKYPNLIKERGEKWLHSENIWLQRTMILYQLKYKEATDEDFLYFVIRKLKEIDEFFNQKAIAWALREYSKTNPDSVRKFIESENLSKLAVREGSKYI